MDDELSPPGIVRRAIKGKNLADLYDLPLLDSDVASATLSTKPWHLYRVNPTRATALRVHDPGGATSWSFDG